MMIEARFSVRQWLEWKTRTAKELPVRTDLESIDA
jgi:hypothetical protein